MQAVVTFGLSLQASRTICSTADSLVAILHTMLKVRMICTLNYRGETGISCTLLCCDFR